MSIYGAGETCFSSGARKRWLVAGPAHVFEQLVRRGKACLTLVYIALSSRLISEGVVCVVSAKVLRPQFNPALGQEASLKGRPVAVVASRRRGAILRSLCGAPCPKRLHICGEMACSEDNLLDITCIKTSDVNAPGGRKWFGRHLRWE
jgi:hypothetical protein